ncbi:MAG: lysophospholipid acyltransferase family protein [Rhizobiaceae bacterium]
MIANLRFGVIVLLTIMVLLVLLPLHLVALVFARFGWTKLAGILPLLFHRIILRLFGVRLTIEGKLAKNRPLLLVSNHISWLDIVVLAALEPLSFVAKAEMASWPVFGQLAKLQRTVFVKREERRKAGQQANEIAERITAREIMVLFPEGTTSDGYGLLPFKTPLFEAAKMALISSPVQEAIVQPIAIDYTHLHGLPLGRALQRHVAWPGEVGLGESLIPLVREGALDVTVHVGEPIILTEQSNRKIVAAQAATRIREMLRSSS